MDKNAQPGQIVSRVLPLLPILPFIICIIAYVTVAHIRHKQNPRDMLVPTVKQLADGFRRVAFEPDRQGEYRLLSDTIASARRIAISVALLFPLLFLGVVIGLNMGVLPYAELLLYRFVVLINKSPVFVVFAVLLIPILNSFIFIVFGLNEASRIAVIVIASTILIMPSITLNSYLGTKAIFKEETANNRTLNNSASRIMYRVVLPRILPKVLESIRLKFWVVILLWIAVEWRYAGTSGFGYRISLAGRYYNAMSIIIPYIIWIGFLVLLADLVMWVCVRKVRGWVEKRYMW